MKLSTRDEVALQVGTFGPALLIIGKETDYLHVSDLLAGLIALALLVVTAAIATSRWLRLPFSVMAAIVAGVGVFALASWPR